MYATGDEMDDVRVLTVRRAAQELGTTRHLLGAALMARELTSVTVDGKPAVLVDAKFRAYARKTRRAALEGAA